MQRFGDKGIKNLEVGVRLGLFIIFVAVKTRDTGHETARHETWQQ